MTTVTVPSNPLLTQPEAAAFLRANPRTLERWRMTGAGPPFVKIGRKVGYRLLDLEVWLEQQRRTHTGAPAAPSAGR